MTSSKSNGVLLTEDALKVSDKEAFELLLSGLMKPNVPLGSFDHDAPVLTGTDRRTTSVNVRVSDTNTDASLWGYRGTQKIQYRRVGLNEVGRKYGTVLRADLPTTSRVLMSNFFKTHGLFDRSDVFVDEVITTLNEHTFFTKADSFLLTDSFNFNVRPLQRKMDEFVLVTKVAGFRTPDDFTDNATKHLVDQVEAANTATMPYKFDRGLTSFRTPSASNGAQFDNSRVNMQAIGDGYYFGFVFIDYTRYDFGWADGGRPIFMTGPTMPTTQYILDQVTKLTGFPVALSEILVKTYSAVPVGEVETITLQFVGGNLRYVGDITVDYKAV